MKREYKVLAEIYVITDDSVKARNRVLSTLSRAELNGRISSFGVGEATPV